MRFILFSGEDGAAGGAVTQGDRQSAPHGALFLYIDKEWEVVKMLGRLIFAFWAVFLATWLAGWIVGGVWYQLSVVVLWALEGVAR